MIMKPVEIKVCKKCSHVEEADLKAYVEGLGGTAKFSCIGKCIRKCPELTDKVHGKIDGQHMVCDTKDAFYAEIRKALA